MTVIWWVLIYSLVAYLLGERIRLALNQLLPPYPLRLITLPGIIAHEFSHLLGAVCTLVRVEQFSVWDDPAGGHVALRGSKWSLPGANVVIGLLPFVTSVALLRVLMEWLPVFPWNVGALILAVSLGATLSPSRSDLLPAAGGSGVLLVGLLVLYGLFPGVRSVWEPFFAAVSEQLLRVNSLLLALWLGLLLLKTVRDLIGQKGYPGLTVRWAELVRWVRPLTNRLAAGGSSLRQRGSRLANLVVRVLGMSLIALVLSGCAGTPNPAHPVHPVSRCARDSRSGKQVWVLERPISGPLPGQGWLEWTHLHS